MGIEQIKEQLSEKLSKKMAFKHAIENTGAALTAGLTIHLWNNTGFMLADPNYAAAGVMLYLTLRRLDQALKTSQQLKRLTPK